MTSGGNTQPAEQALSLHTQEPKVEGEFDYIDAVDDCRTFCSTYGPAQETTCFLDLPQVQKNLSKLLTESDASLLNNECCTPFSSEYMWVKSPVLGHGAFGTVYRCRRRGEQTYRFAVKEVMLSDVPGMHNSLRDVKREVSVMEELANSRACHIVKLAAFFYTDECAWIILKLLPGKALKELIPGLQKLPVSDRLKIIQHATGDLLEVLAFSHAKGIAHGDLKPENVFLDLQHCHSMTHVLDWGLATRSAPGPLLPAGQRRVLLQGTLAYLAPEVLDEWVAKSKGREPVPVKACTADMWSAGCLLLEALTGRNPFQSSWWHVATMQQCAGTRRMQRRWGAKGKVEARFAKLLAGLPEEAQSLLQGLLQEDPDKRLTAAQGLKHPFLSHTLCKHDSS